MKKIMNAPENYTDDMLRGIYAAHADCVKCTADDLRCYCIARSIPAKSPSSLAAARGIFPCFWGMWARACLTAAAWAACSSPRRRSRYST